MSIEIIESIKEYKKQINIANIDSDKMIINYINKLLEENMRLKKELYEKENSTKVTKIDKVEIIIRDPLNGLNYVI